MISVISAVKGRYEITIDSFTSIWENASDVNNVEHIIIYDGHDYAMQHLLQNYSEICKQSNFKLKVMVANFDNHIHYQYRNMHRDYWNPMAIQSSGDIVFGLCNDTIILTKNYDKILEESVAEHREKYNHNFFQIFVDDDWEEEHSYCSWIVLTKPCLEIFNGIAPQEISSQGADQFVANVFQSTDIKSIIDLRDKIKTKQISVQKGNYENDFVQNERPLIDSQRPEWPFYSDILYTKKYYHHKLNNKILQSVFRKKNYEKN
jgi:hypothetical protein